MYIESSIYRMYCRTVGLLDNQRVTESLSLLKVYTQNFICT